MERHCTVDWLALEHSIQNGDRGIECSKFLYNNFRPPKPWASALSVIGLFGGINFLEWILQQPPFLRMTLAQMQDVMTSCFNESLFNGYIDMVKYIVQKGYSPPLSETYHYGATYSGNLSLVKYLEELGVSRSSDSLRTSIIEGYYDLVEYLYPKDSANAKINEIPQEVLNQKTAKILDFLYTRGHPLPQDALLSACNSPACLSYLFNLGHKAEVKHGIKIAEYKNLDCMKIYLKYGGELRLSILDQAVSTSDPKDLPFIKYLIERDCPCDIRTFERAMNHDFTPCVEYLRKFFLFKK